MSSPFFARGVNDVRQGKPWDYERGRLWAVLAPKNIPLYYKNGELTSAARTWGEKLRWVCFF
jgi:hypothetical protein